MIFTDKNGKINRKVETAIQYNNISFSFLKEINGNNKNINKNMQIIFLSVNIKVYIYVKYNKNLLTININNKIIDI